MEQKGDPFIQWLNHRLARTTTNNLQAPFQILSDFGQKVLEG